MGEIERETDRETDRQRERTNGMWKRREKREALLDIDAQLIVNLVKQEERAEPQRGWVELGNGTFIVESDVRRKVKRKLKKKNKRKKKKTHQMHKNGNSFSNFWQQKEGEIRRQIVYLLWSWPSSFVIDNWQLTCNEMDRDKINQCLANWPIFWCIPIDLYTRLSFFSLSLFLSLFISFGVSGLRNRIDLFLFGRDNSPVDLLMTLVSWTKREKRERSETFFGCYFSSLSFGGYLVFLSI